MGKTNRLDCKCHACGYVWTAAFLPIDMDKLSKFAKSHCPKCHADKPFLAGKGDMTTEDTLRALIRRAHDAVSRCEPDGISTEAWNQLVADMAKELGVQS